MNLRSRPLILLFGDSITQQGFGWPPSTVGWASFLARDYARRADVVNRGFSGYNTQHAVEILASLFAAPQENVSNNNAQQQVLFTTVFFGANDAALPGELQHVPVERYGQNLATIVHEMKKNLHPWMGSNQTTTSSSCLTVEYSLPVVLMTPPPVDIDAWYKERGMPSGGQPNNSRANENAKLYGEMVKQVGKDLNCSVLDVFALLGGNGSVDQYGKHLRDGLHLSESGNELVYQGLMKLIQEEHAHLMPMMDGNGKYGTQGVPLEGNLWREMCNRET